MMTVQLFGNLRLYCTVLYCTITLPRPVQVRAGGGRGVLDHQVIPRRQGVSHEGDANTICTDSTVFVYKYANYMLHHAAGPILPAEC